MPIFKKNKSKEQTTNTVKQAAKELGEVIEQQPVSQVGKMDTSSYQEIMSAFSESVKGLTKEEFYKLMDQLKHQYDENLVTDLLVDSAKEGNISDEKVSAVATNLSDKNAVKVIEGAEIPIGEQVKIVDSIENEEMKQLGTMKTLQNLYENCDTKNEWELGSQIRDLGVDPKNVNMMNLVHKIVAKKIAIGFREVGGPKKINTFTTVTGIMPAEEMLQCNLPQMVEQEYEQLALEDTKKKIGNKKHTKKVFPYRPSALIIKILDELAVDQVQQYGKVGTFLIPQSDIIMNLTQEQEESFINAIDNNLKTQTGGEEELSILQKKSIRDQMHGEISKVGLRELIHSINTMPPEEVNDVAYLCQSIVGNPEVYQVFKDIVESPVLNSLLRVPPEERKTVLKGVGQVINQSLEKGYYLSKTSPKVKDETQNHQVPENSSENELSQTSKETTIDDGEIEI